jgi:hypothetical protein
VQVTLTFSQFERHQLLQLVDIEERTQLVPELQWRWAEFCDHARAADCSLWVVEDDYTGQVQGYVALRREPDKLVVANMAARSFFVKNCMRLNVISKAREYGYGLKQIDDRTPGGFFLEGYE